MLEFMQEEFEENKYSDGVVVSDDGVPVAPETLEENEEELAKKEEEALEEFLVASSDYQTALEGVEELSRIADNIKKIEDTVRASIDSGLESFDVNMTSFIQTSINNELSRLGEVHHSTFAALENLDELSSDPAAIVAGLEGAVAKVNKAAKAAMAKLAERIKDFFSSSQTLAKKQLAEARAHQQAAKSLKSASPAKETINIPGASNLQWNGSVAPKDILEGMKASVKTSDFVFGTYVSEVNKMFGVIERDLDRVVKDKQLLTRKDVNVVMKEVEDDLFRLIAKESEKLYKEGEKIKYSGDRTFFPEPGRKSKKTRAESTGATPSPKEIASITDESIKLSALLVDRLDKTLQKERKATEETIGRLTTLEEKAASEGDSAGLLMRIIKLYIRVVATYKIFLFGLLLAGTGIAAAGTAGAVGGGLLVPLIMSAGGGAWMGIAISIPSTVKRHDDKIYAINRFDEHLKKFTQDMMSVVTSANRYCDNALSAYQSTGTEE